MFVSYPNSSTVPSSCSGFTTSDEIELSYLYDGCVAPYGSPVSDVDVSTTLDIFISQLQHENRKLRERNKYLLFEMEQIEELMLEDKERCVLLETSAIAVEKMKTSVHAIRSENDELRDEWTDLKRESEELKRQLQRVYRQKQKATEVFETAQTDLDELRSSIAAVRASNNRLHNLYQVSRVQLSDALQDTFDVHAVNINLQTTVASLSIELHGLQEENQRLRQEVKDISSQHQHNAEPPCSTSISQSCCSIYDEFERQGFALNTLSPFPVQEENLSDTDSGKCPADHENRQTRRFMCHSNNQRALGSSSRH